MAGTQTREQIRVSIGTLLGVMKLIEADASGSTTTILTDELPIFGGDDFNGKWLQFTSGQSNIDGQTRQVVDSSVSSNQVTLTFYPAVSNAPVDGATAEVWDQGYDPEHIHQLINQAVSDATGFYFDPTEGITLHSGGSSKRRFDIPTTFEYLSGVYVRSAKVATPVVQTQVWSESVDSDITVTLDDTDRLYGRVSTKMVIGSGISDGDIATVKVDPRNLSNVNFIEFPIKAEIAVAASDLIIRLSASANGADTDKLIAVPALTAGVEQFVRVEMSEAVSGFTPTEATAIISVALEYNANSKANTIHIGDIEGTDSDSYQWELMDNNLWRVNKEARDLEFFEGGASWAGYSLLRLVGGDNPLVMTVDTDTNEVPDDYLINRAIGHILRRPIPGESSEDAEIRRADSSAAYVLAEQAKGKFPILANARFVT